MGRPRATGVAASRHDAREDVLDAAAELFTTTGYTATTTRAIAELAGLRQASLYYHFPAKEDLLAALLAETVDPSVAVARELLGELAPAEIRLWALTYSDIRLLGLARHNLGVLCVLPEVKALNLTAFRLARAELKDCYRALIAEAGADPASLDICTSLAFGLVESVASARRDDPHLDVEAHARHGADAVLRLAGLPGASGSVRAAGLELLQAAELECARA